MKDELITMSLLSTALSIFVEEPVLHVEGDRGGEYAFVTYPTMESDSKEGHIEHNFLGNYDVFMEEKLVYEVEGELFEALDGKKGLITFYKKMKGINYKELKAKSKIFVGLVLDQAETMISNPFVPVEPNKNVIVGSNFIFSDIQGNKFVINLN